MKLTVSHEKRKFVSVKQLKILVSKLTLQRIIQAYVSCSVMLRTPYDRHSRHPIMALNMQPHLNPRLVRITPGIAFWGQRVKKTELYIVVISAS
jgi:hypothetical protein